MRNNNLKVEKPMDYFLKCYWISFCDLFAFPFDKCAI